MYSHVDGETTDTFSFLSPGLTEVLLLTADPLHGENEIPFKKRPLDALQRHLQFDTLKTKTGISGAHFRFSCS